jgi:hypothetical protein
MDDLPFDFTRYLSQRLGVSSEQATDLLRSWLKDYEPVSCSSDAPDAPFCSEGVEFEGCQQLG